MGQQPEYQMNECFCLENKEKDPTGYVSGYSAKIVARGGGCLLVSGKEWLLEITQSNDQCRLPIIQPARPRT